AGWPGPFRAGRSGSTHTTAAPAVRPADGRAGRGGAAPAGTVRRPHGARPAGPPGRRPAARGGAPWRGHRTRRRGTPAADAHPTLALLAASAPEHGDGPAGPVEGTVPPPAGPARAGSSRCHRQ